MKYITNRLVKVTVSLALVVALLGGTAIKVNAAATGSKKINDTYGKLTGTTTGNNGSLGKVFENHANTTKKVPRLRSTLEVVYYSLGDRIGEDKPAWQTNVKKAVAQIEMSHFKNKKNNNKKDGFVNTKCTAYGCAEAIVKDAYTVYTSYVY